MKISIVIPAHNEENGIGPTLKNIPVERLNNDGYDVEMIVVDNLSTDTPQKSLVRMVLGLSLSQTRATVMLTVPVSTMPLATLSRPRMPILPIRSTICRRFWP